MNVGWNFRREHLHPNQRSHYVITDGGDQPNVVPREATVWYYFREMDYADIQRNYDIAKKMAEGAALMTDTEMTYRVRGRGLAAALQQRSSPRRCPSRSSRSACRSGVRTIKPWRGPCSASLGAIRTDSPRSWRPSVSPLRTGGAGVPTTLATSVGAFPRSRCASPSNIPGLQGHHWSNAIAMATPICAQGSDRRRPKSMARTALKLFMEPQLVEEAWAYFNDVQSEEQDYTSFITAADPPPTDLNEEIMATYRPLLEPYYFDETRFDTYLEQLGITYPTLPATDGDGGTDR